MGVFAVSYILIKLLLFIVVDNANCSMQMYLSIKVLQGLFDELVHGIIDGCISSINCKFFSGV